ncbi:cell division cycle and apoptosis regulator protein [Holotrichia oblita]|uniref:Cell division cycle and apoptosis regulator protein n=1 Tax=Holotrichia oblita TaxID=644536 RepID=A0ACB9T0F1_HOLOL|nr:cell division cycle and apoptosis regulator protein [Holotrichia oblita]
MSNLAPFGANKNTPWRTSVTNTGTNLVGQTNTLQQQIMNPGALNNLNSTGMVPFQQQHQQQVFQNAMTMQQQNLGLGLQQMANTSVAMTAGLGTQLASNQLFQQVGAVTYPNPRALNPTAFQTQGVPPVQNSANPSTKQRVFTGTVTKVHDNFGFVDEDVFFQTTACVKGSNPMVGDRVLVEASYNPSMPFKWNATRIQVLPMSNQTNSSRNTGNIKSFNSGNSGYNAVPPPADNSNGNFARNNQRPKASLGGRGRERSRDRDREEEELERKKRREDRTREREKEDKKSPLRRRSRSPKSRRRSRIVPRYMVQIPKIALDLPDADVLEIRRRYSNLYIPSDFFTSSFRWIDAFPADKPFTLNKPCFFHIMNKEVDPVSPNDAVLEPPDADYLFSAKVMLMSVPGTEELYQKCCAMAEDKDRRDRDSEERDYVHPTRLVNFLVGLRGKNETMAIGGPWSPSLDGENPEKDQSVLIKTAIRTCKALTGIDLSNCTKWTMVAWLRNNIIIPSNEEDIKSVGPSKRAFEQGNIRYRFVELYYRRSETSHKGKAVPARVETVVIFLPDVWSCVSTRLEWDGMQLNYRKQLERRLKAAAAADQDQDETPTADEKASNYTQNQKKKIIHREEEPASDKLEPTHYSQLDPKSMPVMDLRNELKARGINSKGLKSQLIAKLSKALKAEAEKTDDPKDAAVEIESDNVEEKKTEAEERKLDEKEKAQLEKRYSLPDQPHIIVHPSKTAKSGKFDCTVMSISLLLDYRPEDTKEHSFEVSLFAELFNEMLMRDFGFNIYKALYDLPEKAKEKEEKRKKDEDKKSEEDKRKDDKIKDEDKKKEEKDTKDDKKCENDKKKSENDKKKDGNKKEDKKSEQGDSDEEDYEEEDDSRDKRKSDKDKKKRDKPKMFTKDRNLLLSFVYFDQTHCGYIFEKDIEDLLYTLGLSLSRAQVKKLVSKVITRDSLHYRKLTDKPRDDDFIVIDDSEREANLHQLAVGNKRLVPVFRDDEPPFKKAAFESENSSIDDGLVTFRGALVDVAKLMAQLERSDKARIDTENKMVDLKSENTKLTEKNNKCNSTIKSLSSELKENKERLKTTEEYLTRLTSHLKLFQHTLVDIRDKIDPVLKTATMKEDLLKKEPQEKERKHDETKTRWEKESKDVVVKEESNTSNHENEEANTSDKS